MSIAPPDLDFTPRTTSWFTRLPPQFCRIGISRGIPRHVTDPVMASELAPGPWFRSVPADEYRVRYKAILDRLDPHDMLDVLLDRAGGRIPALACFEPPTPSEKWCHRGLVSAWFYDTIGLEVYELGQEREGFGWAHPKLNPAHRLAHGLAAAPSPVPPPQGELLL